MDNVVRKRQLQPENYVKNSGENKRRKNFPHEYSRHAGYCYQWMYLYDTKEVAMLRKYIYISLKG